MINIIIPAYNCRATLGRTLSSLVAQTDTDFEVIVVDDCSTEDIKSIVDDYSNKLHIIYIQNEKNLGCGMTRQVGIDNATQKFITFLDSDDMFMPYTVETFNAIIAANPEIEYVHSYFYEQMMIDGNPTLFLRKDGFMWCHGKLYNIDVIKKFGIKNSPTVRWADDSYFNSMCSELLEMQLVRLPMYLWCNNQNSIVRREDPERDKCVRLDFLKSMVKSVEFVLQYKDRIDHLGMTINKMVLNDKDDFNEEERNLIEKLLQYSKE